MIPPGTLILHKNMEHLMYTPDPYHNTGVILSGSPENNSWGETFFYRILFADGSVGYEYETWVRNYYEVCG